MKAQIIKVTVEIDDRKITLEGPEDFVKAEVARLTTPTAPHANPLKQGRESTARQTEREIVAAKRPKNQTETVAVLGFCLLEHGKNEFTEADVKKAYLRAGVKPPKVIAQALRDAKNNFDFIESGSKRGTFRLSPHGERTVRFELPRGES